MLCLIRTICIVASLAAAVPGTLNAQAAYPSKPIRVISGGAPGTPGDVVIRIISEPLAAALGQPVIVENRPGAINTIGLGAVAKAEPDGHTLGVIGLPSTVAPSLLPQMPYDAERDLAPVRQLTWVENVLVVRNGMGTVSLVELVASAKAQPGKLSYASGGNGTPAHLVGELFKLRAGIGILHVPYKGAVAGVTALIAEQVDLMFATAPAAIRHVNAGRLRPLATPAPSRLAAFPNVPTLNELGYTEMDVRDWHGIVAPSATPRHVIAHIAAALSKVLAEARVKDRLAAAGMEPITDSEPDEFGRFIRAELVRWARVVRESGIRAE